MLGKSSPTTPKTDHLQYEEYGDLEKVKSVLTARSVRNAYKRGSDCLSQLEDAFKDHYETDSTFDKDAHTVSILKKGLLRQDNRIEEANFELMEKYRESTDRQGWLGTLTSVIGFQFNMVRENKTKDSTEITELAQIIVDAFNETKKELEEAKRKKEDREKDDILDKPVLKKYTFRKKVEEDEKEFAMIDISFEPDSDANKYQIEAINEDDPSEVFEKTIEKDEWDYTQTISIKLPYGKKFKVKIKAIRDVGEDEKIVESDPFVFEAKESDEVVPDDRKAPNNYVESGTTMKVWLESKGLEPTDKNQKPCVSFTNRANTILNEKGENFWIVQAWDLAEVAMKFGAKEKYNAFKNAKIPVYDKTKTKTQREKIIRDVIKAQLKSTNSELQSVNFKVGDMVSLYYSDSDYQDEAYEEGVNRKPRLITTHVGQVTEKDGVLYITHNIDGTIHSDKLTDFMSGSGIVKKCQIAAVYDLYLDKKKETKKQPEPKPEPKKKPKTKEEITSNIELISSTPFDYLDSKYQLSFNNIPQNIEYIYVQGKKGTKYENSNIRLTRGTKPNGEVTNTFYKDTDPLYLKSVRFKNLWMPEKAIVFFGTASDKNSYSKYFEINNQPKPSQRPINNWDSVAEKKK
jgi:hypothetical protein